MIALPSAFKQAISSNRRKYLVTARVTLANGTVLQLSNAELWENGGFSREEAVSEDNKFTALGSTIIGSATLSIKNLDESYSSYDFTNAKVTTFLALEGVSENPIQTGVYTVDEASYTEASINLSMLDNMEQFDRPYVSSLTFPATLRQIVQDACTSCGVLFSTSSQTFRNYNLSIPAQFDTNSLTYREVIGMVAAIAGCYAKCNTAGQLVFGWFDRTTLDRWINAYSSSGTMPPASSYSNMHYITSLFSQDISVDPITITGVQTVVEKEDEDRKKQTYAESVGTTGYVISIEKNNILNACTDAQISSIRSALGTQLIGLRFRKASLSHSSNPAIEAGDIAAVWDRKGRGYPILVTRMNFSAFDQQKTVSGCETPLRNSATRYTWSVKNYMESQKRLNEEKSVRELMRQQLQEAIANASGLYLTTKTQNGSTIYYLHNFSSLDESPIQIMVSTAGITVTANGTAAHPTWYGLTVDGNMIANILAAVGVDADWINTGSFVVKKGTKTTFKADVDTGNVTIIADSFSLSNGDTISSIANSAATSAVNAQTQQSIFNKLTNNGATQGIYLNGGKIYLNFSYAQGGTLKLGGANNGNGLIEVYNASDQLIGKWDKDGLSASGNLVINATPTFNVYGGTFSYREYLWVEGYSRKETCTGFAVERTDSSKNQVAVFGLDNSMAIKWRLPRYSGTIPSSGLSSSIRGNLASIILGDSTYDYDFKIGLGSRELSFVRYRYYKPTSEDARANMHDDDYDMFITVDGKVLAFDSSSSVRYKHNINYSLTGDREPHRLLELPVAEFVFNEDHPLQYSDTRGKTIPGIIAEDVERIYPSATIHKDGQVESWDERRLIPGMLALIQEQARKIEQLEERIAKLESRCGLSNMTGDDLGS